MPATVPAVNAWIYLAEDEPPGTTYYHSNSAYQTLIQNDVYQSVDMLFIAFVLIVPTGPDTVPAGDGSTYTLQLMPYTHTDPTSAETYTNQDYMDAVIRDARASHPNIRIGVTLNPDPGDGITQIGDDPAAMNQFAANLLAYLENYDLDGFDIDWESPLSDMSPSPFNTFLKAIRAQLNSAPRPYYLTLTPDQTGQIDAHVANATLDFMNLQIYGDAYPSQFPGVTCPFLYGAYFEGGDDTAQKVFHNLYDLKKFTVWRLNSGNFKFEQEQQVALYQLVHP